MKLNLCYSVDKDVTYGEQEVIDAKKIGEDDDQRRGREEERRTTTTKDDLAMVDSTRHPTREERTIRILQRTATKEETEGEAVCTTKGSKTSSVAE